MGLIIEANNLTKEYTYFEKAEGLAGSIQSLFKREKKTKLAISDFTLRADEGEFIGLMGRNGAGKTTLIKMLTGIITPTGGEVSVCGYCPSKAKNRFKKEFAVVMGQKSQLWWDLPASDSLLLNKAIYEIPDKKYRDQVAYFTKLFDVEGYISVPVRKLSLGERMKFELIASLLHMPRLLLLDEPTIGLDAVAQRQIRQMLKTAGKERGITLLLTSHYTEDLLELTHRCLVLHEGKKIYDGDLQKLLSQYSINSTIHIKFSQKKNLPPLKDCEVVAENPYDMLIRTKKKDANHTLKQLLDLGDVENVTVSEDDVTLLVERVYRGI